MVNSVLRALRTIRDLRFTNRLYKTKSTLIFDPANNWGKIQLDSTELRVVRWLMMPSVASYFKTVIVGDQKWSDSFWPLESLISRHV